MEVETKPFDAILADQAMAAQSAAARRGLGNALLDFSVGSLFRAMAEGFATVALWLQGVILQLLATTRASTSRGADLDTWMADYGLLRTAPTFAGGNVVMGRFTPALPALVPVGAMVRTSDRVRTFLVRADPLHQAWDATMQGYRVAAGAPNITVPVRAVVEGEAGNVSAASVTLLASAIPGIDTVTNPAGFTGGADAEEDDAFRAKFVAFLASLSRATREAISFAVDQVRPGLTFGIIENEEPDGTPRDAYFQVIVDDGSGQPSSDLLATVAASVENYRPLGVSFAVLPPLRVTANVSMTVATAQGVDHGAIVALVGTALADFINGLDLGEALPYTRLAQVAYAASPLVGNVTNVLLNGGTADILAMPRRVIRAGTVAVA